MDEEVKETYTDQEIALLLKKPDMKSAEFSEYRNWVIINYVLGTGNRAGTIINIKIEDVSGNILRTVNAKYIYGLTATPKRQDGQHPIIFMQCGPIRYHVDAAQSGIARYVLPRFTSFRKPVSLTDQEFGPAVAQNYLSENAARNNMILADIRKVLAQGRTPIVLISSYSLVNATQFST